MSLVERNHLVEQLTAAASHPSLRYSVLPGACNRTSQWRNAHGANRGWHFKSIFGVVIKHDESGDVGMWEGISKLLSCPDTGWMPGDFEVQDTPAIMGNDEEAIQKAKGDGRHCEEIHCGNRFAVVMQKGSPALRRFAVSGCTSHLT